MEERQAKRVAESEFDRKLEAIQKKVLEVRELLERAEANMELAAMHRARARELRRAINS